MTVANQKILYEHFLSLIDNPRVNLSGQENRAVIDKTFIVKQAKEQSEAIDRIYNFSGKYPQAKRNTQPSPPPTTKTKSKEKK